MNIATKLIAYGISIPARWKGMRFGKDSFIAPGYDWLFLDLHHIILGNHVVIGKNAWIQTTPSKGKVPHIEIRDNTHIGRNVMISAASSVLIGKSCLISYNVSIIDHDHRFTRESSSPMQSGISPPKDIVIGNYTFIGAHSFITKGVQLGKHCIVGANSVVTRSFPAFSVIAGNPARKIKSLPE